jgi:hypothetical protein
MPEGAGPVVPLFVPKVTPEVVLDGLREAVSEDTVLSLHNPVVERLTHILNLIRWKLWAGPRCDSQGREQIEKAVWEDWTRHNIWPVAQQGYADPGGHTRWINMDLAAQRATQREREELRQSQTDEGPLLEDERAAREREEKVSALEHEAARHERAVAAADVRRRTLELAAPILSMRKISGWHDFAAKLLVIFCAELPSQSKDAAYRFIARVMPAVTGEAVRPGTLKKFVNRSARESGDN